MQIQKPTVSVVVNAAIGHILDSRSEGSSYAVKSLLFYPGPFFKRYPRKDAYLLITFAAKGKTVFWGKSGYF